LEGRIGGRRNLIKKMFPEVYAREQIPFFVVFYVTEFSELILYFYTFLLG
jgi:hypothetical protein